MNRITKQILIFITWIFCLLASAVPAAAFGPGTAVFRTVESASPGCTLVALDGQYVSGAQAALERINAIRYEACREGVEDPRHSGRALTPSDYVPIKWSSSLEYIARVRAAEASVVADHVRPNGQSCFTAAAPDGLTSGGEVLAWSFSESIVEGINLWYGEKNDWVKKTGNVTGHYTQMIDPDNTYVGIGCFLYGGGYSTTAGEFSTGSNLSSNTLGAAPDCRVIIEVKNDWLSAPEMVQTGKSVREEGYLDKGDQVSYALGMAVRSERGRAFVLDAGQIHWTSDSVSNARVDSYGNVQITGPGQAVISAVSDSGLSASVTVSPVHKMSRWNLVRAASKTQSGLRERKCTRCGEVAETQEIPQIGAILLSSDSYTYNGRTIKPTVSVRDVNGKKIASSDYTVSYSKNKNVGKAFAKVTFKSDYAGTETVTFTIRPRKVSGVKASGARKSIRLSWKRTSGQVSGYEIEYSTNKDFADSRILTVKKKTAGSSTIKKLKAKKKYYVRIRSYRKAGGTKITSTWSKKITVKTRK